MIASNKTSKHYSQSFELRLNNLPTKSSDRIALSILYPGILCGIFLIILGAYEFLNGILFKDTEFSVMFPSNNAQNEMFLISPAVFDVTVIIIGIGIVVALMMSYIRYRKILFDGETVTIIDRKIGRKKVNYSEAINNYEGVQLRIEFFQWGFVNRNRYIIELRHKNRNKVAPLYISTSGSKIREIWKRYAKTLNLPALIQTDDGLVKRDVEDLNKSIKVLHKEGKIENSYDRKAPLPSSILLVRKKDKTVLKMAKICWDVYNLMLWFIVTLAAGFIIGTIVRAVYGKIGNPWTILIIDVVIGGLLIWGVMNLFRKDKIVIKAKKIVIVHKFPLGNFKKDEIQKNDIEAIVVTENPATGRYFLSLTSDEKSVIFGKKLPIEDLNWVRKYLINNIIQ